MNKMKKDQNMNAKSMYVERSSSLSTQYVLFWKARLVGNTLTTKGCGTKLDKLDTKEPTM